MILTMFPTVFHIVSLMVSRRNVEEKSQPSCHIYIYTNTVSRVDKFAAASR